MEKKIRQLYSVTCGECEFYFSCKIHRSKKKSDAICNGFKREQLGEIMGENSIPSFRELMMGVAS